MSPDDLASLLGRFIEAGLRQSVMIWGAPGIGKSATVAAVAKEHGLELIDLRISQLAPTDLRGLPIPSEKQSRWLPPEFLPTRGRGARRQLFLPVNDNYFCRSAPG